MSPNRHKLVTTYHTTVEITSNDLATDGSYDRPCHCWNFSWSYGKLWYDRSCVV